MRLSIALALAAVLVTSAPVPGFAGGHHARRDATLTFGPPLRRPAYTGPSINGLPADHPLVRQPFVQQRSGRRHFARRPFGHRFAPFPIVSSPIVVYSAPAVTYTTPPPVYDPPVVATVPVLSRVIEYPNGRYELLGDGITTPYQWVWIPTPPPPPPPPADVPAAPPAPPAPAPAPAEPQGSRDEVHRDVYRWTDEHGVTTWTDQWDKIPMQYRDHAQRLGVPSS